MTRWTLLIILCLALPRMSYGDAGVEIKVLSSRPEMVTGNDALVQIAGITDAREVSVWADGRDVTDNFHTSRKAQAYVGLIKGLVIGENLIEVRDGRSVVARLSIVNHAITGPLFSGPHQAPFICETLSAGLGNPVDDDCSVRTQVTYIYRSTRPDASDSHDAGATPNAIPKGFRLYDPKAPRPSDLAEVTTTEGKRVPYIVRWEKGTINRAIYHIALLHQPGTPLPDPWTPASAWNGRLVYAFGGGCGGGYHQGRAPDGVEDMFLGLGYAEVSASLDVLQNNCNDVISAETAAMVKEHFIKSFGVPVHTIGWGGSGGSIQQYLIAQNYPGILDAIIPSASFPDAASILPGVVDCSLLAHFFERSSHTWTDAQKTAVSGFATWGTCTNPNDSWIASGFAPGLVQAGVCNKALPVAMVYDPKKNPGGARCDYYDNAANVFAVDSKTHLARRALDNVGVQYGLVAFNRGIISFSQFLELNQKIGGYDADGNITSSRMAGDPEAIKIAYSTGRVNTGSGGLSAIPIIDVRQYTDPLPDIHDQFRSFVTRARIMTANGRADNQVILTFPAATKPGVNSSASFAGVAATLVPQMDQWLDTLSRDTSQRSLAEKIAAARPADLTDACWSDEGGKIVETRSYGGAGRCNQMFPPHGDPRIAAGATLRDDTLKCALKPVGLEDYARPLSSDQMDRLKSVFPSGVCDYSVPGVGQNTVQETWRQY